jgi:anaerobic magnesium-protoporphyrin IX monomethyl ester cyclase
LKVLFLEIDAGRKWAVASIGAAFIAAFIRRHNHQAAFLCIPEEQSTKNIIKNIKNESPDLLALSLTSRQWLRAKFIIERVKNELDLPVMAGGLLPTFSAGTILNSPGFDYVCHGEGEQAMLEFLDILAKEGHVKAGQIQNIQKMGAPIPSIRPPLMDLNSLPFMARDFLNEQYGVMHMVTQRGCPFSCTYCAAWILKDLYKGHHYLRRRSVENILQEVTKLKESGTLNYIIFLDDTFTANTAWVKEFCDRFKEIQIGFSIHARVETVNQKMIEQLKEAGCKHIVYGVESGSNRVRKEIMNRPLADQQILDAVKMSQDAGIITTVNYMMGLPGETLDDIDQTLALNKKLAPHDFSYFVFYPYPGTKLFKLCQEKGYLPEDPTELPANNSSSILNLPNLSQDEIKKYYDKFTIAREENHLRQYGSTMTDLQKRELHADIQENAQIE